LRLFSKPYCSSLADFEYFPGMSPVDCETRLALATRISPSAKHAENNPFATVSTLMSLKPEVSCAKLLRVKCWAPVGNHFTAYFSYENLSKQGTRLVGVKIDRGSGNNLTPAMGVDLPERFGGAWCCSGSSWSYGVWDGVTESVCRAEVEWYEYVGVEARYAYGYCFEDRPAVPTKDDHDVYDAYEHKFFANVDIFNVDNEHNDYDVDDSCAGVADHG
jgi:hypothetical protein